MESVETQHDPRCSYWVDQICVCQQIAELEEKVEWLGQKPLDLDDLESFRTRYGPSTFAFYGTMTAGPPYGTYPTSTAAPDPWIPKRTAGIAEVDYRAAARADLYARYDELKKKAGF